MEILQIFGFILITLVFVVVLRQQKPELALMASLAAGIIIFVFVIQKIGAVITVFSDLAARANVSMVYLGVVLKIVAIAYIADFGAQLCKDSGENALAGKISLAAKVLILVLAVPIVLTVLDTLMRMLE